LLDGLASVKEDYDYVIIDCPPNFNIVTKTAIVASDRILVPAIPDYLSTLGIEELRRHITELVNDYNDYAEKQTEPAYSKIDPSIMGVISTMVQVYDGEPIWAQSRFINRIKGTDLPVFDAFVRRNNSMHGDRTQYGVPVVLQPLVRRVSTPTQQSVIAELEELTTEFLNKV
jgi:chromosome partitioning protein